MALPVNFVNVFRKDLQTFPIIEGSLEICLKPFDFFPQRKAFSEFL